MKSPTRKRGVELQIRHDRIGLESKRPVQPTQESLDRGAARRKLEARLYSRELRELINNPMA